MLVPRYIIPTKIEADNFESFLQLWNEFIDEQNGILVDPFDEEHYRPLSICLINALFDERDFRIKSKPNYWDDLINMMKRQFPDFEEQISKLDPEEFKETSNKYDRITRKIGAGIWSSAGLNMSLRYFPSVLSLSVRVKLLKSLINFAKEKGNFHHWVTALIYDALKETIENSFSHSDSESGCFVSIQVFHDSIEICTLDRGIGIHESLKSKYPELVNSEKAIKEAMKKSVTRTRFPDRGKGLWVLKHSISKCGGRIRIFSGDGIYTFESNPPTETVSERSSTICESFRGTIVDLKIVNNADYEYWDDEIDEETF